MKRRIISLLLAAVMVFAIAGSALAAGPDVPVKTKAQVEGENVTVTISARESTFNGKLHVTYELGELSYVGAQSDATVFTAGEKDGTITFGYAVSTADTIKPGETIAVLTFQIVGDWTGSVLKFHLENFNDETGRDQELPGMWVTRTPVVEGTVSSGTTTNSAPNPNFSDVTENDWFYDAVNYVVSQGYFKGISDTQFGPYQSMSRAMFVTVLGRMSGVNASSYTNDQFTDVVSGSYYEGYVVWAAKNGIVQGTSETTFSPDAAVTREQMAAFLYRYAKYLGMDVSLMGTAELTGFADAASVSDWAVPAVLWAVRNGIINGTDKGLEPAATANRAQVAQIIYRFDDLAK